MGQLTDLPTKENGLAMGAFGDRLRREREMRGITLDEITESTKISRRHLEALENERFDQLPGGVFAKGFVRAYAHFLGIDEDQAVADYSSASHEQPEPEDKFPLEIHEEPKRELNTRRSKAPLVFAIAALVGVLVGYFFWLKSKPHGTEVAQSTHQAAATTETTPADVPPASAQATVPASAPAPTENAATAPAPEEPVTPKQQTPPAAEKKPAEKTFIILVKAKEDAWVSIVADGKSVMEKILSADRKKKVKAGKQVVLRTGNAGGIDVSFNGKPLGALGNENEPRTLTFTAAGLVQ
ncbi:MAG TPA: RodZ domain-containing protein [Candidatus Angelobacter sp.]|nr:RodZ domain-containing protein [Candidatus Angelobacter sp.]